MLVDDVFAIPSDIVANGGFESQVPFGTDPWIGTVNPSPSATSNSQEQAFSGLFSRRIELSGNNIPGGIRQINLVSRGLQPGEAYFVNAYVLVASIGSISFVGQSFVSDIVTVRNFTTLSESQKKNTERVYLIGLSTEFSPLHLT